MVIIGGGVIGTSVAYHLAKLGWTDVVLLERDQLTSGTTWHAAGLIVSGGMTTETLAWMTSTIHLYAVLEDETGQSTGFKPVGYLQTASNPDRMDKLRREADFLRLMGIETRAHPRGSRRAAAPHRPERCARRVLHGERGACGPVQRGDVAGGRRGRVASASCRGRPSPGSNETPAG